MTITQQQYTLSYKIATFNSLKVTKAGVMQNGINYGDSLTIKLINIIEEETEEFGIAEKEQLLEIQIKCDNPTQVAELNMVLRTLKANGVVFELNGLIPAKPDNSSFFRVVCTDKTDFLIQRLSSLIKKESKGA